MIEDIRNSIAGIDANIGEANRELAGIYQSMVIPEDETNLQRVERLGAMLEDALLTSLLIATHYQGASGHRKTAEEAIAASGISIETAAGEKILGAMIRGSGTMDRIPDHSAKLHDQLGGLAYRLIALGQLEEAKGRAEGKARIGVDMCALALKAAGDTSRAIKERSEDV